MAAFTLQTDPNDSVPGTGFDDLIIGTSSTASTGTWQRATDTILGGGGTDTFQVTILDAASATILDTDLQHMLSVEIMTLLGGFGANVTLGAVSDAEGLTELNGAGMAGNMTVNASGRWNDITIDASKGTDTLTGGMGNDTFRFTSATLNYLDTVKGGGFGDTNTLEITDKAALLDSAFTHVSDVQRITLTGTNVNATGQKVTLGALSVAAGINEVDVLDNQAATLDASARTVGVTFDGDSGNDVFIGSQGHDNFNGGDGNDSYQVKLAKFGNDIVDGGSGSDEIRILDSAPLVGGQPSIQVTDSDFFGVYSVERLAFNAIGAQTVTLGTNASTSGLTTLDASKLTGSLNLTVNNTFDNRLTIDLGSGADTLNLGDGSNHEIVTASARLTGADHITGNTNNLDYLRFTDAVHLTDLYFAPLTNISHLGYLWLDNISAGQTFTAGANFANFVTQTNLGAVVADAASATASITYDFSNYNGPALRAYGTGGSDTFIAGNVDMNFQGAAASWDQGGADTFKFKSAQLDSGDIVHAGSSRSDKLILLDDTTAIVDADFTKISGVDLLNLAAMVTGSYSLTLGTKFDTSGFATIDASLAGVNVTIDAHTLTTDKFVIAGAKNNVITLGSGDDMVSINPTTVTTADIISGGTSSNGDTLRLTAGGTITATNLAGISGFEYVQFSDLGNNLTLPQSFVTSADNGVTNYTIDGTTVGLPVIIITGKGSDVVDESNGNGSVAIIGSAGADKYIGSVTDDIFYFAKSTDVTSLTQLDGGTGDDSVTLDAGTYTASQFLGFKNIEELHFGDANLAKGTSLTLNNTLFSTAQGHDLLVGFGKQTGNTYLDTTAVTDASAILYAIMGQGNDTVKGGAENDRITFGANSATGDYYLDSNDKVDGGAGHNTLEISDSYAGTVFPSFLDFQNVRNVQNLMFTGGANTIFNLTLDTPFMATGINEIDGTNVYKALDVDASGYGTGIKVLASGGNDNLILTDYSDTVVFDNSGFFATTLDSNDTIDGGSAGVTRNTLEFIGDTTLVDADFTNVSNMTEVDFVNGKFSITLGAHTDLSTYIVNASQANHKGTINGFSATDDLSLTGSNQDDTIFGGSGSDTIIGGRGGDVLAGFGSGDLFLYLSAADSFQMGADLTHADTIADFGAGDQIGLSTLVGSISAITSKGTVSGFTTTDIANFFFDGSKNNAVAVAFDSISGNTRIYVDTDKNGALDMAHDMVIQVNGNHLAALASSSSYS